MSAPRRLLYISDIHMASRARYDDATAWFEPREHLSKLLAFLDRKLSRDRPDELILLGDIFENWLAPIEVTPCPWDTILTDNPEFLEMIRAYIERGVRVLFTPGNHDLHLGEDDLTRHLPGAEFAFTHEIPGALHAEHGHEGTFFNSRALDPLGTHPPGYFFARLGKGRLPGGHSVKSVFDYIRSGALTHFHKPNCLGHIMRTIFTFGRVRGRDCFMMEDGRAILAEDVVARYEWALRDMSLRERAWRLIQRPTIMLGDARKLSRAGTPLVLFGHSHHARVLQYPHGVYANPGAWCQERCHAVEVDLLPERSMLDIRLLGVHESGAQQVVRHVRTPTQPTTTSLPHP